MNPALKEATVHGSKDYPFALYQMNHLKGHFHVSLHWHEELELIYIMSGTLYLTINNHVFVGKSGDLFIVNSKEIHEMYVENGKVNYATLLFPPSSFFFQEQDNVMKDYLLPLGRGELFFENYIKDDMLRTDAAEKVKDIIRINKEKAPLYRFGTKVLLFDLLYLFMSRNLAVVNTLAPKGNSTEREILSYISDRYTGAIHLQDIADTFHMSPKYFSRYFHNTFHVTLTEYITRLRMERAAMLLNAGDLSITEVSLQSGYNNVSFFIRTFQKTFGCSPKNYH